LRPQSFARKPAGAKSFLGTPRIRRCGARAGKIARPVACAAPAGAIPGESTARVRRLRAAGLYRSGLAVSVALVWDLMGGGILDAVQVRRLLDRALLALEEDQHDSRAPRSNAAARRYLESMLTALERSESALPEYQR
jgi:hypothetical protein